MRQFIGRQEWLLAAIVFATTVLQAYFDLKVPEYIQEIIKRIVTPGTCMQGVPGEGSLTLVSVFGLMIAMVATECCTAVIGTRVSRRMHVDVFERILSFSLPEVGKFGMLSPVTRSANDVNRVQLLIVMGVQALIKFPILAAWAMTKIFDANGTWTVATSIAVAMLVVLLGAVTTVVIPRLIRIQRITDDLNWVTCKHLTGLRVIRSYNAQRFCGGRFEETNAKLTRNNTQVMAAFALLMPALMALTTTLTSAIYALGAGTIDSASGAERITLFMQMVVFSAYALQIVGAFMMLAFISMSPLRARVSWKRILEVLDAKPSIRDGGVSVSRSGFKGAVESKNVSFRYPDAEDDAFEEISFIVEPGQTVAITGLAGSGKSSIVNLTPRFYDMRERQVLLDRCDVCKWTQEALRNRIPLVSQKATLFSGMIASNIGYGKGMKELAPADVVEVACVVNASGFIATKEDDYALTVVQGGSNFSGGQKQRLLIAWAVARDDEVTISDDSFSALDYRMDRDMRAVPRDVAAGVTITIVAQWIGIVRNANKILAVDKGRIVGIGTHGEFFMNNPVYREIALSQLSEGELA